MRANHSFKLENVILDSAHSGGGFPSKHIQSRTQPTIFYRAHQRRLVDHLGSRSVYEVRTWLHCREELFVDQISRVIVESDVNADHFGCGCDLEGALLHFDSQSFGTFESQRSAPGDDWHSECFCPRNHLLSYSTDSDQSQGARTLWSHLAVFFFIPASLSQIANVVRYSSVERQN